MTPVTNANHKTIGYISLFIQPRKSAGEVPSITNVPEANNVAETNHIGTTKVKVPGTRALISVPPLI